MCLPGNRGRRPPRSQPCDYAADLGTVSPRVSAAGRRFRRTPSPHADYTAVFPREFTEANLDLTQTSSITGSLFGGETASGTALVQVLSASKPTGKAHKEFQRLIKRIESCRERIEAWRSYSIRYNERILRELEPLRAEFGAAQREMVLLLDELLARPTPGRRLCKTDRAKLRELLLMVLDDLMMGDADAELHALRARHGGDSPSPETGDESDALRGFLKDVLGFEFDAETDASAEELLRETRRKMQEEEDSAPRRDRRSRSQTRGPGGKGSDTSDAAADPVRTQRRDAAEEAGQSLRDVFRKLVSVLHPDREPDVRERQRKTLLMQRVNQAYEKSDLLTLLTLQLEIEQIDAAHLSSLPAERLAHYNHILREQLKELEAEQRRHAEPYQLVLAPAGRRSFTPADVDRQMSVHLAEQRAALRMLHEDLVAFRDPDRLRERLARVEPEPAFETQDELDALAEFLEIAQLAESFSAPPRRRRATRSRGRGGR